jgi:hypothetical protein
MKQQTTDNITAFLTGLALFALLFLAMEETVATSTSRKDNVDVDQSQRQSQSQDQQQQQQQEQVAMGGQATGGNANASNDGVSVGGDTSNVENNSSNVVLVPNNNTESCVRVWGIAFGRDSDSAALGIPWRSRACDYEQAADDAFAAGERELGWFWKCQNKSLARVFKLDGMTMDEAKLECHKKSVGMDNALKTIDDLKRRLEASEEYVEYLKSHQKVCDESLKRCEKEAYGTK